MTILSVSMKRLLASDSFESLSVMTESAPLHIRMMFPLGSFTITDILFLVEVNSQMFRRLYFKSPFGVLIVMTSSASNPANSYPNYLAAFTRASSSGEAAL